MFYIGISLEKAECKAAILKKEKNTISVHSLHCFPSSHDNVKLFYNLPPFQEKESANISSGLICSDLFIRKLHIPLKEKRKLLAALPFQLESLLPFAAESVILCPLFRSLGKQMTSVTAIATAKKNLSFHLEQLEELGIQPDTVSCVPMALIRFGLKEFPEEKKVLCFEAVGERLSCIVYEEGELILSQSILLPSDPDAGAIELEKLLVFLKQKGVADENTPWFFSGDTENATALSQAFHGKKLEAKNPEHASFAVPIGLALDALSGDLSSVQFCQKNYTPKKTWQMRKKATLSYLSLCLGAALLMAVCGKVMLNQKQKLLSEELQKHLSPSLAKGDLSTPEGIEEALYQWEKSAKGKKSAFPFLASVPKVSDVLAWLSAHPTLSTEEGGAKEGVQFKSLHYSLTRYPKIGEAAAPYAAQVSLEFTSETPRAARDFHEALLRGDPIVNSKKEIKWHTQNQTYQTTFELAQGASS